MNKPHYRKPQAVRELERMALDHFRRDHPNFPEYAIPPQSYRDNTANGLTKCIVDYIRYNGGQAERVATIGMPEQRGGRIVWRIPRKEVPIFRLQLQAGASKLR